MIEEILDTVIKAAEATAAKASGNDKDDWNNFADALRLARNSVPDPVPTPHE
jgi:hypothetical protein